MSHAVGVQVLQGAEYAVGDVEEYPISLGWWEGARKHHHISKSEGEGFEREPVLALVVGVVEEADYLYVRLSCG